MLQARVTMRRLCVRLIEKTRQQMAALGLSAASDSTNGKRPSSSLVTAVTNGAGAALCSPGSSMMTGPQQLWIVCTNSLRTPPQQWSPTRFAAGGSNAAEDLSKLLQKAAPQPDSIFITKLLEANNKLLGRPFTDIEVGLSYQLSFVIR